VHLPLSQSFRTCWTLCSQTFWTRNSSFWCWMSSLHWPVSSECLHFMRNISFQQCRGQGNWPSIEGQFMSVCSSQGHHPNKNWWIYWIEHWKNCQNYRINLDLIAQTFVFFYIFLLIFLISINFEWIYLNISHQIH